MVGSDQSGQTSKLPSLCSYNDNSSASAASPSERPVKYCTEGTPTCFSRVSSLSSLHSADASDAQSLSNRSTGGAGAVDVTLQAIDENQCLDTTRDRTLKNACDSQVPPQKSKSSVTGGGASSTGAGGGKTVTFDSQSQVQETPLMFSRCSSFGSLSSFDVHSLHSSVMSDYSRITSGLVSPSELPDSPSDTMPPTPSRRKSPTPAEQPHSQQTPTRPAPGSRAISLQRAHAARIMQLNAARLPATSQASTSTISAPQSLTTPTESTKNYADEGGAEFSCASSLSALTFDDEPPIVKDPTLKRIPLGEEDGMSDKQSDKSGSKGSPGNEPAAEVNEDVVAAPPPGDNADDDIDDDFDDDVMSESDELLLQELIAVGMPPSKRKILKSASDNALKSKDKPMTSSSNGLTAATSGMPRSATTPQHLNISVNNTPQASTTSLQNVSSDVSSGRRGRAAPITVSQSHQSTLPPLPQTWQHKTTINRHSAAPSNQNKGNRCSINVKLFRFAVHTQYKCCKIFHVGCELVVRR